MTDKIMTILLKRRKNLCHDYLLVRFLIYPNLVIIKDAAENNTKEHNKEIKRLLSKLFIDPTLVGQARVQARADLVNTFWKEYSDFNLCKKTRFYPNMWFIFESPGIIAHECHKTYSVGPTNVLGKLVCIVTSKNLGNGSAERHWKIVKAIKTG